MTQLAVTGRIMINLARGVTHEAALAEVFSDGIPADPSEIKRGAEKFFSLTVGSLNVYVVTDARDSTGNILVRPQATFGQ